MVVRTKNRVLVHVEIESQCNVMCTDTVHGCMAYTERALRRQQFHVAPDI